MRAALRSSCREWKQHVRRHWPPSEAFQTALRMSRQKSLAPSGGEEARPTGDHPDRHAETEAAVRSGPRYDGTAATGHSMHGVLAAIHCPRRTCRTQVLRHSCTDEELPLHYFIQMYVHK